jgi:flagellar hook-associated protein FlgK
MKRLSLILGLTSVVGLVAAGSALAAAPSGAPDVRPIMGELTKIEGKTLTIAVRRQGAEPTSQTATVDDATEITTEMPALVEDLKVGDRVRITQQEKRYYGEVAKIEGKTLTLKSRRGGDQKVTVDDKTAIMVRVKAKFEDLKVGQFVMAFVKDGKASRVDVREGPPPTRGGTKSGK